MSTQDDYLPLVAEQPWMEPAVAFERLQSSRHVVFFDSALADTDLGRYSFLAADPFLFRTFPVCDTVDSQDDALAEMEAELEQYHSSTQEGLPPFQGGAAFVLSYDIGRQLERLPRPRYDEFQMPALSVGFYDVIAAFDHQQKRMWLISHGWPECEADLQQARAQERIEWLLNALAYEDDAADSSKIEEACIAIQNLAPQYPTERLPQLTSDFSPQQYFEAVSRCIEYIFAGDIFQVNLAQRLLHPAVCSAADFYRHLRAENAATFAGYFDLGRAQVASASPERLISLSNHHLQARPIKGTRPRRGQPEADLFQGDELLASEKDRAENVMIVDLLRNDLSRVCTPDSVMVRELCRLETYAYVKHLVSIIEGTLAPGQTAVDVLRRLSPGGSITGAPKVRAMEIIAELEPAARGAYCGSLGYIGFDGTMDANILIRTVVASQGWWQFSVGGGIVAASDPQREYDETWHKAEGILRAIRAVLAKGI